MTLAFIPFWLAVYSKVRCYIVTQVQKVASLNGELLNHMEDHVGYWGWKLESVQWQPINYNMVQEFPNFHVLQSRENC